MPHIINIFHRGGNLGGKQDAYILFDFIIVLEKLGIAPKDTKLIAMINYMV